MVFKVALCGDKSSEGGPGLVKGKTLNDLSHVGMLLNSRQVESK